MEEFKRNLGKLYVYPLENRTQARIVWTRLCQSLITGWVRAYRYGFEGVVTGVPLPLHSGRGFGRRDDKVSTLDSRAKVVCIIGRIGPCTIYLASLKRTMEEYNNRLHFGKHFYALV